MEEPISFGDFKQELAFGFLSRTTNSPVAIPIEFGIFDLSQVTYGIDPETGATVTIERRHLPFSPINQEKHVKMYELGSRRVK